MAQAVAAKLVTNPYHDALARTHSAYTRWSDGNLIYPLEAKRKPDLSAARVHDEFRAHVLDAGFPCVGAKAALNGDGYRFGFYTEMNTPASTAGLAHDLWEFVREQPLLPAAYTTFIAVFENPVITDEANWEKLLWAQLQSLHNLDFKHYAWDATVGSDPHDSDFSFSFAGRAFFVVGLHPASSRKARRFAYPTLVFNSHDQFVNLRESGTFERMRHTIRARDLKLQGSLNPNLSDYGEQSEARQYSGRAVEEAWKCPFHARLRHADNAHE